MNEVATQEFDYGVLDAKTAKFAKAKATKIRAAGEQSARSLLEMGSDLKEVRERMDAVKSLDGRRGDDTWSAWLGTEVKISQSFANTLIQIADKFGGGRHRDGRVQLSYQVMGALVPAWVPEQARQEVIERAKKGEKITGVRAREIARSYLPKPSEARHKARETGIPVEASDGMVYTGATREEEQKQDERRNLIFNIKRNISDIANVGVSPEEWLEQAKSWQLFTREESDDLLYAVEWLTGLRDAWEQRRV